MMKIKNIFEKWNDGNIDENNLYNMNKSVFDKMDNELLHIYNEQLFLLTSMDIILCDFDFENVRDNLYDLFNDNIDKLTNDLIECVKKYKNTGVNYNETK